MEKDFRYYYRKLILLLFILGLAIRLIGSFTHGTQDVEWWKAWSRFSVKENLSEMYGGEDARIASLLDHRTFEEINIFTRRMIEYDSFKYWRSEFQYVQPPFFVYPLYLGGQLYQLVNHDMPNTRVYNFFVNLFPVLASLLIAYIIYRFIRKASSGEVAEIAALFYWLNPLVILNSPIQGYQDPICALFALLAVVMIYNRKLLPAYAFLTLALMTKPQGVLVAPIILVVGLTEYKILENIKAWGISLLVVLLVSLPFIVNHHGLSIIIGVSSINDYVVSQLSGESLNIWWPYQYYYRTLQGIEMNVSTKVGGFPLSVYGTAAFGLFTLANLFYLFSNIKKNRDSIITAAAMEIYGFFMLRAGILTNHYFLMMPLFALLATRGKQHLRNYAIISLIFLAQDLLFYGFGRDYNKIQEYLIKHNNMALVSNGLAVTNALFFFYLSIANFLTLKKPLLKITKLIKSQTMRLIPANN